jgi:4-amino-4-deoxy-L-arabinose transferase-like glycosyltransferase
MLSSAGILSALDSLGHERGLYFYRLFLAIVDGLNVLVIYWMLKKLAVKKAAYWAGMIGISISSWAGGALWVQIDGISQFFLLTSLAWIVRTNIGETLPDNKFRLYLITSALLLSLALLTKQLTLFSAVPLGLLLATSILFRARQLKQFILNIAITMATLIVSIFSADFFLNLKAPYFSHLYYIWKEGSSHSKVISGNGFNIWMFLGRDMWSSSHVPIFSTAQLLTPYNLGMLLFLLFGGLATLSLGLFLKERFSQGERFLNREILLNFIFYLALINLCFNVFLTGTHERYLYHFYPYILIAVAGMAGYNPAFSQNLLAVLVLGASIYGIFILQIMSSIDFNIGYLSHWLLGLFHLGLLYWLMAIIFKYQNFPGILIAESRKGPKNLPTVR